MQAVKDDTRKQRAIHAISAFVSVLSRPQRYESVSTASASPTASFVSHDIASPSSSMCMYGRIFVPACKRAKWGES